MARQKGESTLRKHFKLTENPRSKELELMRLRNEINKIGVNVNQIVKNSNSHIYSVDDKISLEAEVDEILLLMKIMVIQMNMS